MCEGILVAARLSITAPSSTGQCCSQCGRLGVPPDQQPGHRLGTGEKCRFGVMLDGLNKSQHLNRIGVINTHIRVQNCQHCNSDNNDSKNPGAL